MTRAAAAAAVVGALVAALVGALAAPAAAAAAGGRLANNGTIRGVPLLAPDAAYKHSRLRPGPPDDAGRRPGTSTRCCTATEGRPVLLACAAAADVIVSVEVADYGTPTGYCGAYGRGACTSGDTALQRVRERCVGQSTCEFVAGDEEWVGPDPCPGTGKALVLQWTCSDGPAPAPTPVVAPTPLRTSGRYIVDATGQRMKMAAVNWCTCAAGRAGVEAAVWRWPLMR